MDLPMLLPWNSIIGLSLLLFAHMMGYMIAEIEVTTSDGHTGKELACVWVLLPTWGAGIALHLCALDKTRMQKSAAVALLCANGGMAYQLLFAQPDEWYRIMLNALWPAYAGLLAGAILRGGQNSDGVAQGRIHEAEDNNKKKE